ncbi:MAG: VTT domain-containing protein [Candidatus Magasanikbacteria bacterium]|nr:VTT domain-containing protein [Candidatus Magasanikbacteria bacterium]
MIKTAIDFILHFDVYLTSLIATYGNLVYLFLFLIIFVETGLVIMPFLPGDSLLFIAYWLGRYFGEKVFAKFINPAHIEKTKSFFNRYGKKTIVLARFIPIVRTFAPFVAGIGKMDYFSFLSYNIIGGISWIAIFVFSGYYFGNIQFVKDNLTAIVLLIIIVSIIPAVWKYIKHKRARTR